MCYVDCAFCSWREVEGTGLFLASENARRASLPRMPLKSVFLFSSPFWKAKKIEVAVGARAPFSYRATRAMWVGCLFWCAPFLGCRRTGKMIKRHNNNGRTRTRYKNNGQRKISVLFGFSHDVEPAAIGVGGDMRVAV